ncbi:MAG: hypothetical protein HC802_17105 [Caldilineaceae bacterium]|nr:hypothetical protein [Caldilineaceae bacterium]
MWRGLLGLPTPHDPDDQIVDAIKTEIESQFDKGERELPAIRWGFDVQFLIERPAKQVDAILADIASMGDYALVEGDSQLVKVHVHVFNPGVPLSYAVQLGFVTDVVVENMDDGAARAETATARGSEQRPPIGADRGIGVVAIAAGSGFAALFRTLGAHSIVLGGQSMNPSTAELAAAVESLPHRQVMLLPNNGNILLAAQQAAQLTTNEQRQVAVAPVRTLPQGVAALLGLPARSDDLDSALAAMMDHASRVQSGEVTVATRDLPNHALALKSGDLVGLVNGELAAAGQTISEVVLDLLEQMNAADSEIVTLYFGEGITESDAENLAEIVAYRYPEQELEVAYGGQPHYLYILSVE